MTNERADRIRRAYPTGTVDGLDEDALESLERDERLRSALNAAALKHGLVFVAEPFGKPAYSIAITGDEPPFREWVWRMDNQAKIAWIQAKGEPYPVLWLRVSRVADYYYHYYNHWVPRGDTGYLDADCTQEPNERWKDIEEAVTSSLRGQGFEYFSSELSGQTTDLVMERDCDSIPDDDLRWDDPDFEPNLAPASLHECLFSH